MRGVLVGKRGRISGHVAHSLGDDLKASEDVLREHVRREILQHEGTSLRRLPKLLGEVEGTVVQCRVCGRVDTKHHGVIKVVHQAAVAAETEEGGML